MPKTKRKSSASSLRASVTQYTIECLVMTRAGEVPIRGVHVSVNEQDLGGSDSEGKFKLVSIDAQSSFKVIAIYQNIEEYLKKEEMSIEVKNIDSSIGSFEAKFSNKIEKIQNVAGKGSKSFFQDYSMDQTNSDEISYDAATSRFIIKIKMATLSLNVPYMNQNSLDDTVTTIIGKDPEPASHTHEVVQIKKIKDKTTEKKFSGSILCFPTSVHMLLKYWGTGKSRAEIMQKVYEVWANEDFAGRRDKINTVQQANEPPNAVENQRWLDTSKVTDSGYILNERHGKQWQAIPDSKWRVENGGYKIWTLFYYQSKALNLLKPVDTTVQTIIGPQKKITELPVNILNSEYTGYMRDEIAKGFPIVISTTATDGHIMIIRGVVVDKDNNVEWLIVNDPYGTLAAPCSIYESIDISDSVGKGGVNKVDDVKLVQEVLKAMGYYRANVTGACDGTDKDLTVKAIKQFQKKFIESPDGKVSPDDDTEKKLNNHPFASYTGGEGERNASYISTGPESMLGKHVYYNKATHGKDNKLQIKGKDRGVVMLTMPLNKPEVASRLTMGIAKAPLSSYRDDDSSTLKLGDIDETAAAKYGRLPTVPGSYIYDLQTDLKTFGFVEVGLPTGSFDQWTENAVFNFQRVAASGFREDQTGVGSSVQPLFIGEPTGKVDQATLQEIDEWKRKGYRRPYLYGCYLLQEKDQDSTKIWGGLKREDDGKYIEQLQNDLVKLGYWISDPKDDFGQKIDGNFGTKLQGAVYLFQREHGINPTGKLDLNTAAILHLTAKNLASGVRYNRSGVQNTNFGTFYQLQPSRNFYHRSPDYYGKNYLGDVWGQKEIVNCVMDTAQAWAATGNKIFEVGDMSKENGGSMPQHSGHKTGKMVDINSEIYCKISTSEFNKELSLALANEFFRNGAIQILFNCKYVIDRADGDVKALSAHHHHFHVTMLTEVVNPHNNQRCLLCKQYVKRDEEQKILKSEWERLKGKKLGSNENLNAAEIEYVKQHSLRCFYPERNP